MPTLRTDISSDTLRYLDKLGFVGWQLGLQRIEALNRFFGHPDRSFHSVHIAGTNGKGSTSAMLTAMAQAAGLRVGLYTSPHLVHVTERIQINGKPIAGQEFEAFLRSCGPRIDALNATYFEVMTAMAFKYFAEQRVDLAVIETGLGGRLDATNIITPDLAVITSIGLEHQNYLGKTLAQIAAEKAGIIKPGRPCVSGVRQSVARAVVAATCAQRRAQLIDAHNFIKIKFVHYSDKGTTLSVRSDQLKFAYANLQMNLLGQHQVRNAVLAILAALLLRQSGFKLNEEAIRQGLATTQWPGRLQLIGAAPPILIDAAHNPDGMQALARTIAKIFPHRGMKIVISLMTDKAVSKALRPWKKLNPEFFFAAAATERALPASQLLRQARTLGLRGRAYDSAAEAFTAAKARCRENDLVCVAGSHYLIGDLMRQGHLPYPY